MRDPGIDLSPSPPRGPRSPGQCGGCTHLEIPHLLLHEQGPAGLTCGEGKLRPGGGPRGPAPMGQGAGPSALPPSPTPTGATIPACLAQGLPPSQHASFWPMPCSASQYVPPFPLPRLFLACPADPCRWRPQARRCSQGRSRESAA